MSAVECLEHKWLCESSEPPKSPTKDSSTTSIIANDNAVETNGVEVKNDKCKDSKIVSTPPKSTGFFLHPSPKNGAALDEVLFSNLNGVNTANTNVSKTNGTEYHHHPHIHVECAKQTVPVNNSGAKSNCTVNDTDLLKDYAINKENINLSKILSNRMPNQSSANQIMNNLSTLHNNNSPKTTSTFEYADDPLTKTTVLTGHSSASASQTKLETVLFPDAPTTPKVLRKSNQSETDAPSCVALVKQFQFNNCCLSNRIDEINETTYGPSSPNRSKFCNLSEHNRDMPSYRLSATAIATSTAASHHSLGSSTLSINTLTESSVGVSQPHSNSTITINCLCGADKTANCCCNSSSRAALNYRKKSLAVVDNSILC